ncbi:hypothetical protein PL78_08560 [Yersinia entomophaga]|uniref:Pertussis toxin subunit 1 n=1 Tax=Yersinia entomophaga TaxID=935293 RepID=A0ABM6BJN3_YERET|nr:hypothetical protein [Yersinia entomophaga]ANI29870.1 hypothetical protein PL78_08560 [Yersinia entomophaga]OWF86090.1 hypothetical protein B4914_15675 [Yersinia entomophaga]
MQGKFLSLLINTLFIIGLLFFYISASYAIYPVNLVYRADTRDLGEINAANGMRPWAGPRVDYDLIHHFDGESVDDYTSAFVSTSASFRHSIEHAASLARANSEEPFEEDFRIFIYAIRPESNFYEVEGSIAHARDTSAEHSPRQAGLSALLHNYGGMEEWVALEGISAERIISFIEITGEILQNYYQSGQLFSNGFWINRWQPNLGYNSANDGDISSSEFYTHIGNPRGYRDVIQGETLPPLAASFTCITPNSNSMKKRQLQNKRCKTRKGRHFYFVNRLIAALENNVE